MVKQMIELNEKKQLDNYTEIQIKKEEKEKENKQKKFNEEKKNRINQLDKEEYKIVIDIQQLPIYKIFCNNIFTKLNIKNLDKDTVKNINKLQFESICGYIFLRLFRILFFLDFIHDFYRERTKNSKINQKQAKELITKYHQVYKNDIIGFRYIEFSMLGKKGEDLSMEEIEKNNKLYEEYVDTIELIKLDSYKKICFII